MILRKAFCVTRRTEYSLKITSAPFVASSAFRAKKKVPIDCAIVCRKSCSRFNWRLFDLPLSSRITLPERHATALGLDWRQRQKRLLRSLLSRWDIGLCRQAAIQNSPGLQPWVSWLDRQGGFRATRTPGLKPISVNVTSVGRDSLPA